MGGTFMCLDDSYKDDFIRNLHDALSGHTSSSVDEAVKLVLPELRVYREYAKSILRVYQEYIESIPRVCREYTERVYREYTDSEIRVYRQYTSYTTCTMPSLDTLASSMYDVKFALRVY